MLSRDVLSAADFAERRKRSVGENGGCGASYRIARSGDMPLGDTSEKRACSRSLLGLYQIELADSRHVEAPCTYPSWYSDVMPCACFQLSEGSNIGAAMVSLGRVFGHPLSYPTDCLRSGHDCASGARQTGRVHGSCSVLLGLTGLTKRSGGGL